MPTITEGNLEFAFPENWTAWKYDEGDFYRECFNKITNGIKALDIVAIDPEGKVWLIEIKDYRIRNDAAEEVKPSKLSDVVAKKVIDTLAAILPAKLNGNDKEKVAAGTILATTALIPVLHLEQSAKRQSLTPYAIKPADIQQKLAMKFQRIGLNALVTGTGFSTKVPWTVANV